MKKTLAAALIAATVGGPAWAALGEFQVAGLGQWFSDVMKSPADKATDAEKMEFLKHESNCAAVGDCWTADGRLTPRGEAVFKPLGKTFNRQYSLMRSGAQIVGAQQNAVLTAIQTQVNLQIGAMRASCNQTYQLIDNRQNGPSFSFSCSQIADIVYVETAGRSAFATPAGQQMLQAIHLD